MAKRRTWMAIAIVFHSYFAWSAVLIEEGANAENIARSSSGKVDVTREPVLKTFENKPALSIEDMHREKRVGAGVEIFGKTGLLGITGDFSLAPAEKATAGFGGGPGFVGMDLGYKHFFSETKLAPYGSMSLARWTGSTHAPMDSTNPSFLAQKFLSEPEKNSGQFAHHFLIPAFGLQWTEFAKNAAFFGEVLAFVDLDGFQNIYSGSIGMLYYF